MGREGKRGMRGGTRRGREESRVRVCGNVEGAAVQLLFLGNGFCSTDASLLVGWGLGGIGSLGIVDPREADAAHDNF